MMTENEVFGLIQSTEQFPIDFDDVWPWLDYSRKDNAKTAFLKCNFTENLDYSLLKVKETKPDGTFSHYKEKITLTLECFKSFCMMAGTEKGKQVRQYFLNCERLLKQQQHTELLCTEFNLPRTYVDALQSLLGAEKDKIVLQTTLKKADETIEAYRNLFTGEATLTMKQTADALNQPKLGRNNLIKYLRTKKLLTQSSGSIPTRYAIEQGYLIVETSDWKDNAGNIYSSQTAQFTWKGFCWLVQSLKNDGYKIKQTPQAIWDTYYPPQITDDGKVTQLKVVS